MDFMASTDSNIANMPELLCCMNISSVVRCGYLVEYGTGVSLAYSF
jgi:hypothetical protein